MVRSIPLKKHYDKLGPIVAENLKKRGFEAWYCSDAEQAREKIMELLPKEDVISWGGSMTMVELGIPALVQELGYRVINRDLAANPEEKTELMRQALTCDTFLAGSNAVSEDGQLVNIDGVGNRVAAMIYGPKSVVVAVGMNKVTKTVEDAMARARNLAAPANSQRFDIKTPCNLAGGCHDCNSPDCVCNYLVTTRRCKPAGRIKVVLIGEDMGL